MDEALDADRRLALSYVALPIRRRLETLWRIDAAMGAVIAGGREPLISRIKLAWWRDALELLDTAVPPAEPLLQALAADVLPFGVTGAELAVMEEGWTRLTEPDALGPEDLATYAEARGGVLFALSARLLGGGFEAGVKAAGEGLALADLARHSAEASDAAVALRAASEKLARVTGRWPTKLRPLGMLAALAARDVANGAEWFEPHGAPPRMWRMLGHRLTGR
jgi:phytoene synthase